MWGPLWGLVNKRETGNLSLFFMRFDVLLPQNQLKSMINVLINIKQLLLSFSISLVNENQLGDTIENIDDISAD